MFDVGIGDAVSLRQCRSTIPGGQSKTMPEFTIDAIKLLLNFVHKKCTAHHDADHNSLIDTWDG